MSVFECCKCVGKTVIVTVTFMSNIYKTASLSGLIITGLSMPVCDEEMWTEVCLANGPIKLYNILIMLLSNAMVIDTHGMRELSMWDVSAGLCEAFGDMGFSEITATWQYQE
ncbi:hypothetical protein FACS1894184_16670 [Clostridia bacterium]|nr:hypothetical protein FACS1894184_16670 [Clostridia bacterium]